ncbi:amidohydrolase family protein [Lacimicrobium sp. SS2-24]|uniref:amidohydrolase family protein n=1 Tax=Lacimicrobium sp. SS2-24 TaxID=2005569 RepID=UPI000B4C0230|nr:amidohydrolase family protein [Lacimicrobium sp. SS2-24]
MYRITLLLTLILALIWPALSVAATTSTLYINATLIHPKDNKIVNNGYLLVRDGRFVSVGQNKPTLNGQHQIVDLQGKYVTAGFIDTHAHISLGEVSYQVEGQKVTFDAANNLETGRWNGERLLEHGITTIRNPGGDTEANLAYKKAQQRGEVKGPKAFVAGAIINTQPFDGLVKEVTTDETIHHVIREQAELGVDYIKLYTGLSQEQIAVAVDSAETFQLPVIAHLEDISWTTGAELGIDHLVHAMPVSPDLLEHNQRQHYLQNRRPGSFSWFEWYQQVSLDSQQISQLAQTLTATDTAVDPTLIVFYNTFFADQPKVTAHKELELVHPDLLNNWRTFYHFNIGWQAEDYQQAQQVWPKVLAFVKLLHDRGVTLSIGTDLGNPWVIPGLSYHQEMALLADAGLTPMQILAMATHKGAEVLGQSHQLGRLAPGLVADFVVFGSDPSLSVENTRDIAMVIQAGKPVWQQQK